MFSKLFKGPLPVGTPPPVTPPKVSAQVELDDDGSIVPKGLGVTFARRFCSDLSPETRDSLFPEGLEGT